VSEAKLLSIWVKAPILKGADILLVSECVKYVNPKILKEIGKGKTILTYCPEREGAMGYGKLASIIRASKPKSITVLTIDGSPHCIQLHAAVNEAIFDTAEQIRQEHFVLVDGIQLVKIAPDAVRVARYLSLVQKLINEKPDILRELEKHSLEYKSSIKMKLEKHS